MAALAHLLKGGGVMKYNLFKIMKYIAIILLLIDFLKIKVN